MKEGIQVLSMSLYNHYSSRAMFEGIPFDQYVLEKVQAKGRKYNTISNLEEIPNEDRIRQELDEGLGVSQGLARGLTWTSACPCLRPVVCPRNRRRTIWESA